MTAVLALCTAVAGAAAGRCLWWYAPVWVEATHLEKVVQPSTIQDDLADGARFTMTPDQFRAHWHDVRPILEAEFHDYSFELCYFKSAEKAGRVVIGIDGVGMVWRDSTTSYYARKAARPDLADGR